jgi:hypothetical protein
MIGIAILGEAMGMLEGDSRWDTMHRGTMVRRVGRPIHNTRICRNQSGRVLIILNRGMISVVNRLELHRLVLSRLVLYGLIVDRLMEMLIPGRLVMNRMLLKKPTLKRPTLNWLWELGFDRNREFLMRRKPTSLSILDRARLLLMNGDGDSVFLLDRRMRVGQAMRIETTLIYSWGVRVLRRTNIPVDLPIVHVLFFSSSLSGCGCFGSSCSPSCRSSRCSPSCRSSSIRHSIFSQPSLPST